MATLLQARPLPQETVNCYSLFMDRSHPVHLEMASFFTSFTW